MIKINDVLLCHTSGTMECDDFHDGEFFCKKGRGYKVHKIKLVDGLYMIWISSEIFDEHSFLETEYSEWFHVNKGVLIERKQDYICK